MRTWILLAGVALSNFAFTQGTYSLTYTGGDILSDKDLQNWPGSSICPATLQISVPAGEIVTSTRVEYSFFSSLAGFGGSFQQRSYVACPTTGLDEGQLFLCSICAPTTEQYDRITHIADGVSTGMVEFEMHTGTTGTFGANCTDFHFIQNGTWTITVYTSVTVGVPEIQGVALDAMISANNGSIQIIPDFSGITSIRLTDITGRTLGQDKVLLTRGDILSFNHQQKKNGVYFIVLRQGDKQFSSKVSLSN